MIKRLILLTAIAAGLVSIPAIAHAANSQLTQQILPTDCVLTVVSTETGQQVVGECPTEAPVVTNVDTSAGGQRIVRGLFDSVRTTLLKVTFRGVEYTAGVIGSPLRTAGDSWAFYIDEASPDTPGGNYLIEVEALLVDGRIVSSNADFNLPSEEEVNPDVGFEPQAPNAGGPEQIAQPSYLMNSLSPVDTISQGLYREYFLTDDSIGRPLVAALVTEYGKGAILLASVGIIVFGNYLIASVINIVRSRR